MVPLKTDNDEGFFRIMSDFRTVGETETGRQTEIGRQAGRQTDSKFYLKFFFSFYKRKKHDPAQIIHTQF